MSTEIQPTLFYKRAKRIFQLHGLHKDKWSSIDAFTFVRGELVEDDEGDWSVLELAELDGDCFELDVSVEE